MHNLHPLGGSFNSNHSEALAGRPISLDGIVIGGPADGFIGDLFSNAPPRLGPDLSFSTDFAHYEQGPSDMSYQQQFEPHSRRSEWASAPSILLL